MSLICKDDIYIMTFTEYLKDRYHIDEIINNGVDLSTEDAVNYYQSNCDLLDYHYLIFPDICCTGIPQETRVRFIFPQCDYFYYAKKYYHLLISCLYNSSADIILNNDLFKYSCLHLNDNERDIILNILNRRNMIEHIAILLDTKTIRNASRNFDL